jgi:hypothetical protein
MENMSADLEYFDGFWIDWNELLNDDDESGETVVQDTKRRRCENQSIPVKHQYPVVQVQQVLIPFWEIYPKLNPYKIQQQVHQSQINLTHD